MLRARSVSKVLLSALILAAASPAFAGGKWVRESNTAIISGPTKNTKAVEIAIDPAAVYPDRESYGAIAFLPSGKTKNKLRLGEIKTLSVSYGVVNGVTAGGSPRMSIVIDVNRDGEFDFYNGDEIVYVSLGNDPGVGDIAGSYFISGNLIGQEGRFTTASGSVTLGSWEDIMALSVDGYPVSQGAVESVFTIVDYAGSSEELVVAVTAMQVNKDKLNPKAKIPSTN